MQADASLGVLDRPVGAFDDAPAATPLSRPAKRPSGPSSVPADLRAFVLAQRPAEAARLLGVARGTVYRLRDGYWPADSRALVTAWAEYRGRAAALSSRWFLRRVLPGGQVRHGGAAYAAHHLLPRVGQLVAVARETGGGLLAQSLELPVGRFPLELIEEKGGASCAK